MDLTSSTTGTLHTGRPHPRDNIMITATKMFAIGTEDEFYGGGEGAEPSDYELHLAW